MVPACTGADIRKLIDIDLPVAVVVSPPDSQVIAAHPAYKLAVSYQFRDSERCDTHLRLFLGSIARDLVRRPQSVSQRNHRTKNYARNHQRH
jgi:hypothetical protein